MGLWCVRRGGGRIAVLCAVLASFEAQALESRTRYDYDLAQGIITQTDPNNRRIQYHYNDVNKLVKTVLFDAPATPAYTYEYDATDQLTRVTAPGAVAMGAEQKFGYDLLDRLESIHDFGKPAPLLNFAYDHQDRLTWITYPDNSQACYEYDPDGRITAVGRVPRTVTAAHCAASGVERTIYAYDAQGRLSTRTYPNGIQSAWAYDSATGLLKSLSHKAGATLIYSDAYTYYPGSRLYQSITRTTPGGSATTTYLYDGFERLLVVTEASGRQTEFSYDSFGNRTRERITHLSNPAASGGAPKAYGDYVYEYAPNSNRLNRILFNGTAHETLLYDNAGRLIERTHAIQGKTTYAYDDRNLLTQVITPTATVSYTYDALGARKTKTVNGQTTLYLTAPVFGMSHVLMELAPDLTVKASYVYGGHQQLIDEPVAADRSKDLYLLHDGTVGNITHATTRTGATANSYTYEPFGARTPQAPATAGRYGYTGEEYDTETGLVYLRARYYDPVLGRFISPDPFLGRLAEPITQNRYVYVKNDPLGLTDPSGLAPPPDMAIPPSVNMQGNIVAVGGMQPSLLNPLGTYDFVDHLRQGGQWDYKAQNPVFQDFGNYHYGVMAAAADFSLEETLRAGGLVQNVTCVSGGACGQGVFFGNAPYGDVSNDPPNIIQGWNDYKSGYWTTHNTGNGLIVDTNRSAGMGICR